MNRFAAIAAAVVGMASATAAFASPPGPGHGALGPTPCLLSDISPAAMACVGWYGGNLNSSSPTDKADSAADLNTLLGVSTYTGPTLTWLEDLVVGGPTIDFTTPLYGMTVVSFHVGAAKGAAGDVGYEGTAFYEFNAGHLPGGLDTFSFNRPGLSNARLFSTGTPGIPEPASWALMILGFAGLGATLRRHRAMAKLA